jgi:type II secretory ATPase GspE/PulE/Tfp pilus assembly ATPase PilB-like protein
MGIYEIVENTPELRALIHSDCSEAELTERAIPPEQRLFAAGLQAVANGDTALEEVLRTVSEG